jgi:MazG family protein
VSNWENLKDVEKKAKGHESVLDDIPLNFPALLRAQKLAKKAAKVGFDWPSIEPVFAKLEEEIAELKEAIAEGDMKHAEEELGDVLFVCTNLARHIQGDAENALRMTNRKFEERFRYVEKHMRPDATLEEMDALWDEAKIVLKKNSS